MAASGQPLFCFGFCLVPARRGVARARAARSAAGRVRRGRGGVRYLGHSFYGASAPFWRQSAVTSELREWSRCGGMDSFIKAPRARVAGGADAQRRVPPEGLPGPSRARPRGHPRRRDEQAGAGLSDRRSFRCLAVAGRAPGSVATMSVSPPRAAPKKPSRANPRRAAKEARTSASDCRSAAPQQRAAARATEAAHPTQLTKPTGARARPKEKPSPRRL